MPSTTEETVEAIASIIAGGTEATPRTRRILCGDNATTIKLIDDASVDLLYMDPPFGSARVYSGKYGRGFTDVWEWGVDEVEALNSLERNENPTLNGIKYDFTDTPEIFDAVRRSVLLAQMSMDNPFTSYILHMGVRLAEYRRVLKPTGNFIIHCDQTAAHIIKAMVDAAFGRKMFRNEIIWQRTPSGKSSTKTLPRNHDVILVWGRTKDAYYNNSAAFAAGPMSEKNGAKYNKNDNDGRGAYRTDQLTADGVTGGESGQSWRGIDPATRGSGLHWRVPRVAAQELGIEHLGTIAALDALDAAGYVYWGRNGMPEFKRYARWYKGQQMDDVWNDITALNAKEAERLGYPTQKPVALLDRLIRLYSPEDGHVFDPFGGCGTTVDAAERLGRSWTICDISIHAIDVIDRRMTDAHSIGEKHGLTIEGDWPGNNLAKINALPDPERRRYLARLVGAASLDTDRKGDETQLARGIHGHFTVSNFNGKHPHGILMVAPTGGNRTDVEVLNRLRREDGAEFAVLICNEEPTPQMQAEATKAGKWTVPSHLNHERVEVDRIQFITAKDAAAAGVAEKLPSGVHLALPYVPATKIDPTLF